MSKLFIDGRAIEVIKEYLAKENAHAVRIFASGGCCGRFEISPVKKALTGDVAYSQGGINIYVEKELADRASAIEIKFDELKGLFINLEG